jgi:hypothetical protein
MHSELFRNFGDEVATSVVLGVENKGSNVKVVKFSNLLAQLLLSPILW